MKKIKERFELSISSNGLTNHRNDLFEEVWKEYYPGLKLFSRSYLTESSDLEDVCQEIMIKVFNNLHKYNPLFSFSTWLYTIARNHCIDYMRKYKSTENLYENTLSGSDYNPEDLYQLSEINQSVEDFMKKQSNTDQRIAALRFSQKLKYNEIAKVLQIPSGTIRYRISELKSGLKKYLEGAYETV
jgi:RNA polymerase sigma factor (sigma-70 family)